MSELRQKVVKGTVWTALERFSTQFAELAIGMVLARILTPHDYGTLALTTIFFVIARAVADGGFALALVQKKGADELDFNSVFYASLALALAMYAVMWFVAPWISAFYDVPELTPIVRVSAVSLFFNALSSVQTAELNRKMRFDLSFFVTIGMCVTNAVVGISLALAGFGVWTIVWTGLAVAAVGAAMRWLVIAWRPRLMFSASRLRGLFSFGWKTAAASLLDMAFSQLTGLLVGKVYTRVDLAYVDKGNGLPGRAMNAVENTLGVVCFPALVQLQDEPDRLRDALRRTIRSAVFPIFPVLAFTAVCADKIIYVLFGGQWAGAVPYMRVACVAFALLPVASLGTRTLLVMGRSGLVLMQSVLTKILFLVAIFSVLHAGVFPFASVSMVASCLLPTSVEAVLMRVYLRYSFRQQLSDLLPAAVLSGLMAGAVALSGVAQAGLCIVVRTSAGIMLEVAAKGAAGLCFYILLAHLFRLPALREYFEVLLPVARTGLARVRRLF